MPNKNARDYFRIVHRLSNCIYKFDIMIMVVRNIGSIVIIVGIVAGGDGVIASRGRSNGG